MQSRASHFVITATVFVTLLGSYIDPVMAQDIPNGERCADDWEHFPNNIKLKHDLCRSGYCYPGPADSGENKPWFCIDPDMNCALPGTDGARYGARIRVNGRVYVCQNPGAPTNTARFGPP